MAQTQGNVSMVNDTTTLAATSIFHSVYRHSMGLELDSTAVKGRRATVDVFLSRPSPKSEETVVDVVEDSKARETSPGLFDE